ncbi:MAG: hypothetical protein Q4C49_02015 [Bacillota bacterium]|nr:hypothetical protein [Bacillota bacterium]
MNVNEFIYLYFLKDEDAFLNLYQYYYPLIVSTISRTMADMYHMKDEMLEIAQQVLYECLEKCRVDRHWYFSSFYKRCLQNRLLDFYKYEIIRDYSLKYETIPLDSKVKEDSNTYRYELIPDSHVLHEHIMLKLETERLDSLARYEFSYLELHVLSLKRLGMKNSEIAKELKIEATKVRSILAKLKKWYAMH